MRAALWGHKSGDGGTGPALSNTPPGRGTLGGVPASSAMLLCIAPGGQPKAPTAPPACPLCPLQQLANLIKSSAAATTRSFPALPVPGVTTEGVQSHTAPPAHLTPAATANPRPTATYPHPCRLPSSTPSPTTCGSAPLCHPTSYSKCCCFRAYRCHPCRDPTSAGAHPWGPCPCPPPSPQTLTFCVARGCGSRSCTPGTALLPTQKLSHAATAPLAATASSTTTALHPKTGPGWATHPPAHSDAPGTSDFVPPTAHSCLER